MKASIIRKRINTLRELMRDNNIDCYIIVTDDYHASEYVGEYFKEREYMSGFTGSNGTLVVTDDYAKLWTDGRYFIQAEDELRDTGIDLMKEDEENVPAVNEWIAGQKRNKTEDNKRKDYKNAESIDYTIGYDGRTFNFKYAGELKEKLGPDCQIKNDIDLIDLIWTDRPDISHNKIWKLDEKYSGKTSKEKLSDLRNALKAMSCNSIIISSLNDAAWLYNYRGSDIDYTPAAMAYTVVGINGAILYTDAEIDSMIKGELRENNVEICPYLKIYDDIENLSKKEYKRKKIHDNGNLFANIIGSSILIDPEEVNESIVSNISAAGLNIFFSESPVKLAKAVKNKTEIQNVIKAHIIDGVALTKTIYWIKNNDMSNETELSVEKHLTELRKKQDGFIDLSFSSIVASGDHGAIVHYEPVPENNRKIEDGFLLIDTGGHYLYGTTDVTRTISINPDSLTEEMKRDYTAVLKGHIDLAIAEFDKKTTGIELDSLARKPVNDVGEDYNHGTGHGVGYLLSVHEGPNGIRKKSKKRKTCTFSPGMITSDEPGIYKEGKYGIRIENLILCVETDESDSGKLCFRNLTMAPYDKDSIVWEYLDERERTYLRDYGNTVLEELSPYLTDKEKTWLESEMSF